MTGYGFAATSVALLLTAFGTAVPAAGQTNAALGQPDAARITAARTLVQTVGAEAQMRAQQVKSMGDIGPLFDRMLPAQITMRAQLSDPQGYARMRDQAIKIMTDDRREIIDATIPLLVDAEVRRYAAHYSTAELRALTDFYRSPLGQRLIAEQPNMAADSTQFQQTVLAPMLAAHNAAVAQKLTPIVAPLLRQASGSAPTTAK